MVGVSGTTWTEVSRPAWAAEAIGPDKLLPGGAQLAASLFNAEDAAVVTTTAAADVGATSLAVAALGAEIPSGTLLDFGARTVQTVTAGAAIATATTLPVTALTAPIANGTVLYFGTNKFARLTAAAIAGATSLTVAALPTAMDGGETATVPASSIVARTTANAAAAATSIAVEALAEPILSGDVATYAGGGTLKKRVPAGTLVGRTLADRDSGIGYGPWESGDEEVRLVAFEVTDAASNPNFEPAAHNLKVYENNLPGWATWPSPQRTALRTAYPEYMLAPAG